MIALGERDCSLQRRHQKLVEEAPAPGLAPAERSALHAMAIRIATAARLTNAATCEFLRSEDGAFYFLEVNTRLQVEHGVTELVTGVDIVREQLLLAAGRPLSGEAIAAAQAAAEPNLHAIEVRIAAEDPGHDFAPTPGRISHWQMPAGPGVRVDAAVGAGERVPAEYDNLIAKAHRGRARSGPRHRPPAARSRRGGGRRDPDHAAIPSVRDPGCLVPGRRVEHRLGRGALAGRACLRASRAARSGGGRARGDLRRGRQDPPAFGAGVRYEALGRGSPIRLGPGRL